MAEEAGTVDGAAAPGAGEKPAEQQPSSERPIYTQRDADNIFEKKMKTARQQWEAEQAEKARQSEMTEAQKERARAEKAERDAADAQGRLTYYTRRDAVVQAADGYIPQEFIDAVLSGANGDDFDPALVAAKAKERWDASLSRAGVSATATIGRPTPPRTGGTQPTAIQGQTDYSAMTLDQANDDIARQAQGNPIKAKQIWDATYGKWLRQGGRFKT